MNRTKISIEIQDYGDKETNIIVKGERNGLIMLERSLIILMKKNTLYVFIILGKYPKQKTPCNSMSYRE